MAISGQVHRVPMVFQVPKATLESRGQYMDPQVSMGMLAIKGSLATRANLDVLMVKVYVKVILYKVYSSI